MNWLTVDDVTQYALDVTEGREIAGPHVRDACKRHLDDRSRTDIWFDRVEAERLFSFFHTRLRHSDGQFESKPFDLHSSQKFIIGSLFGWKRAPDNNPNAPKEQWVRRFRRAYIEQGKGNGKSPLVGGIGLYGMLYDGEPGAQIFSAGADRNQSEILFQDAVKMAQSAPQSLQRHIKFAGDAKIWNMAALGPHHRGAYFRPLARTAGKTGSGYRPHMALCDELHEHPSSDVLDLLERGFKFRIQPLLIMITNSGSDRKSLCWREREHAVAVAGGEVQDDSTFAYVCALDKGDDPLEDRSCWKKANPLLGVTITEKYLEGVVAQAIAMPGKRNGVLRLHFCVWTDAETSWITREQWEALEDPDMKIEDFIGRPCRAGLDLSSKQDLCAKALVFDDGFVKNEDGEDLPCYAAFVTGYTPETGLKERARNDRAPYDEWVKDGFVVATPGKIIRFPFIIADLEQDYSRFELEAVAYDRYLIKRFEEDMHDMGVDLPLIEHPQGFSRRKDTDLWMPGSIDNMEELILDGRLRVQVNPALRSSVAGATFIKSPAELKRFAKEKATQRIDMLIALTMAIGASTLSEVDGHKPSVFEQLAKQRAERQEVQPVDDDGADRSRRIFQDDDDDDW